MKAESYLFENKIGEAVRVVNWATPQLYIVQRNDNKRIEFLSNTEELEDNNVSYSLISKINKSDVGASGYTIKGFGKLKLASDSSRLMADVSATTEDKDQLPQYLKVTAASYLLLLLLIVTTSWVLSRFFSETKEEPVVVKVFEQNRTEKSKTVNLTEKKKPKKVRVADKTVIAKSKVSNKSIAQKGKGTSRHGTSISHKGALGALGGFSESTFGSGGVNLNAKTDNPGIGQGGKAARGGYERGLIGKGLVQSGLGSSSEHKVKGYGGYGTSGLGGGRPGYGTMKMAGSSGAYFQPLADESLIEGGLDRDQINAVIQRHIGQIIYCYEQELQSKPNLSGRVAVKFVIGGTGLVNTANVAHTSLASNKVESCIVNKLRAWKFPKPNGNVNVRVTYPFVLKRQS